MFSSLLLAGCASPPATEPAATRQQIQAELATASHPIQPPAHEQAERLAPLTPPPRATSHASGTRQTGGQRQAGTPL